MPTMAEQAVQERRAATRAQPEEPKRRRVTMAEEATAYKRMVGLESGGDPAAVSSKGASGLGQIMPANVVPWTREMGLAGDGESDAEIMQRYEADADFQEQLARAKFAQYVQNEGIDDALSRWHSGVPLAQAIAEGRHDGNISTAEYVQRLAAPQQRPQTMAEQAVAARRGARETDGPPKVDIAPLEPTPEDVSVHSGGEGGESLLTRSVRRAGQDLLATPAQIVGTLPTAASALVEWGLGSVDSFSEGMMNDEGRALVATYNDESKSIAERNAAAQELNDNGMEYMRPGARLGMEALDWAGRTTGVENPLESAPLDETVGSIGLTSAAALPVRVLSLPGLAGRLATSLAGRTAFKALELATPITLYKAGSTVPQVIKQQVLNAAVGTGVDQAVRYAVDDPTFFTEGEPVGEVDGKGVYASDDDPETTPEGAVGTGLATVALAGGGLGLAAALRPGRAARMISAARQAEGNIASLTPPPGAVDRLRAGGAGDAAGQALDALVDDKAIIKRTLDAVGSTRGQEIDDTVRTLTGASLTDSVRRAYEFGDLGENVRVPSIVGWKKQFKSMTPDEQALFDMAYEAGDELVRRGRGIRSLNDLSDAVLHQRLQRGRSNPNVSKLIDQYDNIMKGFTELRWRSGVIDARQYARENQRGLFMRNVEQETFDGIWDKVVSAPLARGRAFLNKRIGTAVEEKQATVGGMKEKVRASEMLDEYVTRQLRNVNNNSARRLVLQALTGRKQKQGGTVIVSRIRKGVNDANTITIFDGGEKKAYAVGDKRLHTALQFRPRASIPAASTLRKWMQKGTTGNWNPMFAPISMLNDVSAGLLSARTDKMVTGWLDQGLATALAKAGMPPQVANGIRTALAGPVRLLDIVPSLTEGLLVGLRGRWLEMAATRAQQIAQSSGLALDRQAAEAALDVFYNSRYARMQSSGYTPNAFVVDYENATTAIKEAMALANSNPVTRTWLHTMESVRESYRMAAFSRNLAYEEGLKGRPLTRREMQRISGEVRNLGGDITKQSSSQTVNAALSAIPYGNTIVQSMAHLVAYSMRNPAAYSVITSMVAGRLWFDMSMTQEAKDYIATRVPDFEKTDTWFYENEHDGEPFDPQKHLTRIYLGPELGLMTSLAHMLAKGIGRTMGMLPPDDMPPGASGAWDRVYAIGSEMFGFTTPPIVNASLNLLGIGDLNMTAIDEDRAITQQPRIDAGMADFRGHGLSDGVVSDYLANLIDTAFGTAGRIITESAEALLDHPDGAFTKEAWADAMDVVYTRGVAEQKAGQWLTDHTKATPRTTPQSNKAYEVDRALEEAAALSRSLVPDASTVNDADLYAGQSFQIMAERLHDPELAQQAYALHLYMNSSQHQTDMDTIGQLKIRQHRVRGSTDASVRQKNDALNALNEEIQDRFSRVLYHFDKLETQMRMDYGEDWSIDTFMRKAHLDLR